MQLIFTLYGFLHSSYLFTFLFLFSFCCFEWFSEFYERLKNPRWRLFNWRSWRNPGLPPGRKRSQKSWSEKHQIILSNTEMKLVLTNLHHNELREEKDVILTSTLTRPEVVKRNVR